MMAQDAETAFHTRLATCAAGAPHGLGAYEIVDLLGSGGMGTVWRGRHRLLDRDAAIKLLQAEQRDDDGARERFETEVRVTAALSSPHTIRVFDFGSTAEGELFYAMELLRGCDLERLVRRFGPVPAERTVHLLAQVCDAVAEAHERGLVHGDIKPANLYTCRMGLEYDFAKVLDFGLARPENSSVLDEAGSRVTWGTPAYMAPEIILGTAGIDRRMDVYALGCVAYFLLTGQLVFDADTPAEAIWQHLHAEPEPPSTRTECVVPREMDDLILACLQKSPTARPRDAAEVKCRLASVRCGVWNQTAAKRWWDVHLPEFSERPTCVASHPTSVESHESVMCPSPDVLAQPAV
jgi:eukaryotic-like serine/threonine-protein kinase